MKNKKIVDRRDCVIITTSQKNQQEVIGKLLSIGVIKSTGFDENGFTNGKKIIFIYGFQTHTATNCHSIAYNGGSNGKMELNQKDIRKYFTGKAKSNLLSKKK